MDLARRHIGRTALLLLHASATIALATAASPPAGKPVFGEGTGQFPMGMLALRMLSSASRSRATWSITVMKPA